MARAAAARVGDPVTHSAALSGLLEGALVGAALGAILVASGGTAAPLVIAGWAATGASIGGAVGKYWGAHHVVPCGAILTGSPNTRYNGMPAAFAGSVIACDKHPGPQIVAEGSNSVSVNGRPAAREGDHGSCGCRIAGGSPNVLIGGAPVSPVGYAGEVPWYADSALLVLGLAGGGALLKVAGLGAGTIAAKLGGSLVGSDLGGKLGHGAGGKLFGEGSRGQTVLGFAGSLVGGMGGDLGGRALIGAKAEEVGAGSATPRIVPAAADDAAHVGPLTAEEANAPFVAKGWNPPYAEGTRARDIILRHDRAFARVHGESNQARSWMMRPEEIEGLTAERIKDKFALPEVPTYVSDVHVPAGTRIRLGAVAPQDGWGRGGAIQYELQERLPAEAFKNRRPLP